MAGGIDPRLEDELYNAAPGEPVTALFVLNDQVDVRQLSNTLRAAKATRDQRHQAVVLALQGAAKGQDQFIADVDGRSAAKPVIRSRPFWILNSVVVEATPDVIRELALRPDVAMVYSNHMFSLPTPEKSDGTARTSRDITPGLQAVNAPMAWAENIDGDGVLVATIDTGVDGDHPALANRWAGLLPQYAGHPDWAWMWRSGSANDDFPVDGDYHGTHTMGTICGGAPGEQIGVAPGATWIAAGIPDLETEYILEAFQWLMDPDGDPSTSWDVPRVCSNSWSGSYLYGCRDVFNTSINACEAAGVLVVFSAGNDGDHGTETIGSPANNAMDDYSTLAIGAVDATDYSYPWPRAGSSSMGPSYCTPDGSAAIKPDLAAPGVKVWSAAPGGDYQFLSGTSMATPHVAGAFALMFQANPELGIEDAKQILYDTARDLGTTGKDNEYGWGMIDAYAAVNLAMELLDPAAPYVRNKTWFVTANEVGTLDLPVRDYDHRPDDLTVEILSLPTDGVLRDVGNGSAITSSDLPYTLVNHGVSVEYEPETGYHGTTEFTFWATDGGTPPEGGYSEVATITVLVRFLSPRITQDIVLPDARAGVPYTPLQIASQYGEPPLAWKVNMAGNGWALREENLGECLYRPVGQPMGWQGDEQTWVYYFPSDFVFPFAGTTFVGVVVAANGYLDFANTVSDPYNDIDTLLESETRIAPLWADLRTDLGGDIFIDESVAGQITIRWVGERWHYGEPVEFSCTLFSDGHMRFDYGPGNTGFSPTVGYYRHRSTYNELTTLTYANSLDYRPLLSIPRGMSISPDGVLGGTPDPRDAGPWPIPVKVTDACGRYDEKRFLLWVEPAGSVQPGDANCDGAVDNFDISAFILAVTNPEGYAGQYDCLVNCDINGDGDVNNFDISPFITLLTK
ncbi:MAG: S8 family serine peptidase [Phycisphaerae bacterium]